MSVGNGHASELDVGSVDSGGRRHVLERHRAVVVVNHRRLHHGLGRRVHHVTGHVTGPRLRLVERDRTLFAHGQLRLNQTAACKSTALWRFTTYPSYYLPV